VMLVDPASGSLKATTVQVARWGAERAELSAGVSPGQWVVAAGGHLLREGQQVRAVDRDNRPLQAAPKSTAAANGN
jgi:membrane fusion protein, multidrug efflux system